MKAVIMAGGEGSRLRPLTCDMPKPMAPLCGKPTITYILDLLSQHNITDATLTLHYLSNQIIDYFGSSSYKDIKLNFVEETQPLGTAGSVKNAVKNTDFDDLLIISGDALCDFDLTKALHFHKQNKSDATLITKRVNDPREYGLVNTDENHKITGFIEKPGWNIAAKGSANTGIYILSKAAVDMIPDEGIFDFAKDLFPKMLKQNMNLFAFDDSGYWCDIGDLSTYLSCQYDLMSGEVKSEYKKQTNLVQEDYHIIEPVYIGRDVTIGTGSVIGPNAVIDEGTTIGVFSKIRSSVVLKHAFIGNNCHLTGSIICEGASLKSGTQCFEGSVVGSNTLIGENTQIWPQIKVWPQKTVEKNSIITENVVYGNQSHDYFDDDGITGETGVDLTPLFCVKIGAAAGSLKGVTKVGIASSGGRAAKAFKLAVMSGILGTGAQAWDFGEILSSQMAFAASFCSMQISIYISGGQNCSVNVLGEGSMPITRDTERELNGYLSKGEYKRCDFNNYQEIVDMSGIKLLYQQELYRRAAKGLAGISIIPKSENTAAENLFEDVLLRFDCNTSRGDEYIISKDGSSLSIIGENVDLSGEQIIALCSIIEFEKGHDISVPYDAPRILDALAEKYGRKVYRYLSCPANNCDEQARKTSKNQLWTRDGIIAAIMILSYLKESSLSIVEFSKKLPSFATVVSSFDIDITPNALFEKMNLNAIEGAEGVTILRENGSLLIRPTKKGHSIKVFAEANNAEIANELCADIIDRIALLQKKD